MIDTVTRYEVEMGFLPPSLAVPDPDHPGLMRAGDRASAPYGDGRVEHHRCVATDLAAADAPAPDLLELGFDIVDLSPLDELQTTLARVQEAGRVSEEDAAEIRAAIDGAVLACGSGRTVTVLHLAGEGLFMRTGGPNRLAVVPAVTDGMNDHGAATSVHVDQDVYGTPLTQVMAGRAPELFRHDSPDGHNHDASLMLVNLWIPLHQITQPLVLADGRSLDRRSHQLRYGLRTETFLDRSDDMAVNDIWTMVHDDGQRWCFHSELDHRSAYVFNTLSTPHGAGVLPGEELAEARYRALEEAERAVEHGDAASLSAALSDVDTARRAPVETTAPLRRALDDMAELLEEARDLAAADDDPRWQGWAARARVARRNVVRTSIEMRVVVSVEG